MPAKRDEKAMVREFREQLVKEDLLHEGDSIGTDDHTLLRYLRARQFNLKQAKIMWKNAYEWRKSVEGVGIDELYRRIDPWDYPEREHVFNCWPLFFHKTDKKGRPLNFHYLGGINVPELYKGVTPERFWQTFLVNCEALTREVLPATAYAQGHPVDGTFVIVDLKGFSLSQFWQFKDVARAAFQVSQDYFPETMAQLAIINAPASFTRIWSFMKPWLAKETQQKIDILGPDYKEVLLKWIDAENLPTSLGGTCTCEGLGGCRLSNVGPWSVGRKERREKWLRGEGPIQLGADSNITPEQLAGAKSGSKPVEQFSLQVSSSMASASSQSSLTPSAVPESTSTNTMASDTSYVTVPESLSSNSVPELTPSNSLPESTQPELETISERNSVHTEDTSEESTPAPSTPVHEQDRHVAPWVRNPANAEPEYVLSARKASLSSKEASPPQVVEKHHDIDQDTTRQV
ncbi:CRAL/TRIO domain-containing protein [Panus rudis PR-1116 ss-1]|nr:CRAL/TRIO domain-containing protein [Panus rudis PR-1116 ss-1]